MRLPSSRSELTEIDIRQKPGFAGLFFFDHVGVRKRERKSISP
jgi:hypothetical protein